MVEGKLLTNNRNTNLLLQEEKKKGSKNTVLALTFYIPFHLLDLSQVYGLLLNLVEQDS